MINYNLNHNLEYVQKFCSSWAERKGYVVPACVGNWSYEEGNCAFRCEGPIEDSRVEPLVGGCAGVELDYRQECCDKWAEENEIVHAMCVGEWVIGKNNSCAWECLV